MYAREGFVIMQEEGGRKPPVGFDAGTLRQLQHDVRSPLNAVMGVSALLDSWKGLDPQEQRIVDVLKSSTQDLRKRLDALFTFLERASAPRLVAEQPERLAQPPAPKRGKRRVLLAEDYQPNALVARTFLEEMGYDVDVAQDGREALARFRDREYSAVLLDVQMPELDGLEAARCMRDVEEETHRAHTPIIALTAHATRDDAIFCKKAGMDDYLSKPFNAAQLMAKLDGLGAGV
jgi:CheY-like chemotaxis protein